eukprot:5814554-Prymnesium_polylepis.1
MSCCRPWLSSADICRLLERRSESCAPISSISGSLADSLSPRGRKTAARLSYTYSRRVFVLWKTSVVASNVYPLAASTNRRVVLSHANPFSGMAGSTGGGCVSSRCAAAASMRVVSRPPERTPC